jgi:hypothetical protein
MWWKLGILTIITVALIFCVIPIRTHAVLIDPANPPPPTRWTLSFIMSNMYVTPGTLGLIGILLAMAIYVGFRIVRSS